MKNTKKYMLKYSQTKKYMLKYSQTKTCMFQITFIVSHVVNLEFDNLSLLLLSVVASIMYLIYFILEIVINK